MPRRRRCSRRRSRTRSRSRTRKQRGGAATPPDLVIAHYKESLDWLDSPPFKDTKFGTVYIYDKSPDAPSTCKPTGANCKILQLPNLGVCEHTYLTHIFNNYDTLPERTVFLPGSADLYHKIKHAQAVVNAPGTLIPVAKLSRPVHEQLFDFVITKWVVTHGANRDKNISYDLIPADVRPFGAWYKAHFPGVSSPYQPYFAILSATRADIHKRPREFYKKLLDEVSKGPFHEANHYLERSWPAIFDPLPESSLHIFA